MMEDRPPAEESQLGRQLATPRAAAIAGILFAALFGTATVLFRLSVPADPGDPGEWLDTNSGRVKLALGLVPFGGIAFLWFIGVVRDRLGDREDRFLSSVMFGSGLLYLAMTFTAAALVGALIATYEAAPEQTITSGIYAFDREVIFNISNSFGVRMAGVFMFSTGSIWLRSGAMPRWIIAITYLLAVGQLVGVGISLWSTMVFPIWVLIVSIHFLVRGAVPDDVVLPDVGSVSDDRPPPDLTDCRTTIPRRSAPWPSSMSYPTVPVRTSVDVRHECGRLVRSQVPRSTAASWEPAADRADPVDLLLRQAATREPSLVPLRHGRMLASPFAFYRGGALLMAADLAKLPRTGLIVQLCGDAHLANFGVYAAPDRRLVFSLNDFDETLPGPFEWDVERLVASFQIAGRHRGFDHSTCAGIVSTVAKSYRKAMHDFAAMPTLDLWYDRLDVDEVSDRFGADATSEARKRFARMIRKAETKNRLRALTKLTEVVDETRRFRRDPPTLVPIEDLVPERDVDIVNETVAGLIDRSGRH